MAPPRTLRQATLGFSSAKGTVARGGKKKTAAVSRTPEATPPSSQPPQPQQQQQQQPQQGRRGDAMTAMRTPRAVTRSLSRARSVSSAGALSDLSEDVVVDDADAGAGDAPRGVDVHRPLKRLKLDGEQEKGTVDAGTGTGVGKTRARSALAKRETRERETKKENLDLNDKAGMWRRHYALVRAKNGHLPLVHGAKETKVHEILRVFDMSYEYGPCAGVTRLERWERAAALGLNPPREVREILLTKPAAESEALACSVLHAYDM